MPSLKTFRVELDRPGATYLPGETVHGVIIVDLAKQKNIRGLFFCAKGEARVKWTELDKAKDANKRRASRHRHYTSSEEYFNLKYNIIGTHSTDSRTHIPVGLHTYPFNFQLPHNIPSSFEHRYGQIRYTVKGVIDRPWKFDHECTAAFTVSPQLNLHSFPEKCLGIDDEASKDFCTFCCIRKDKLNVRIRVSTSGYIPGQAINTIIDYANFSNNVTLTAISTKLIKTLKFHSSLPSRRAKTISSDITSTKNSGPFPPSGQSIMEFLVPSIPPSTLQYCSIIDMDYSLVVAVHVSGLHWKLQRSYPILIGTVPSYYVPSAPPMEDVNPVRMFPMTDDVNDSTIDMPKPFVISLDSDMPYSTQDPMDEFPQTMKHSLGFVDPEKSSPKF